MDKLSALLATAPPSIAVEPIRQQWRALGPYYDVNTWRLPLPPWAARPYDDSGERAWRLLGDDLTRSPVDRPFCLYLHVPFCASKCHFCDCYSFKLAAHAPRHVEQYVDRLIDELEQWAALGNLSRRPLSTVHLGGGTPSFLGESAFHRLHGAITRLFRVDTATEWALESTVAGMTPAMFALLHELSFRRLHIGVQSVEEAVRRAIGRRSSTQALYDCIARGRSLGWVISVDLICGLPGQTAHGFVNGIDSLAERGINGFSLYELLIYPQNARWAGSVGLNPRDHLPNYLLFQMGAQRLEALGLRRNLFNHWADERDDNRYFTFPMREEDCLAVGTIADGVFGDYHFRHPRYASYMRGTDGRRPALEGGLRRTGHESAMRPLTTAILSGTIPDHPWANDYLPADRVRGLFDRWEAAGLVEKQTSGELSLTANGGWFAGNMIRDLTGIDPQTARRG